MTDQDRPGCGETNDVLGLRCDRERHPEGTAHYQDDGNGVRAWYDPGAVAGAAPTRTHSPETPNTDPKGPAVNTLTRPGHFDRPASDLPDLETHTSVYGVRLSEIGDDGDVFALGHVGKLRMIAALNWQARTVWGMDLAEFLNGDAIDQIVHTWMRNTGGTALTDWCLEPATETEPGAFPVTYWTP